MADELKLQVNKTKKRIWLILILLLILIIAALIYLFLNYYKPAPAEQQPNINPNVNNETPAPVNSQFNPASFNNPDPAVVADIQGLNGNNEEPPVEEAASVIAEAFAERFGSYSNQSDYANLDDLAVFMTPNISGWIIKYKDQLRKENPDFNYYYAMETKAISKQVNSLDEEAGKAEITVKTQRQEFKNSIENPRIFYQDILIKLVKIDNEWKVDGAYWQ